jgi:hypothetical protein
MATFTPSLTLIGDDLNDEIPQVKSISGDFKTITIRWKAGVNFPAIRNKWQRLPDGRIEATYTRDELAHCLEVFELISEPRISQGVEATLHPQK